MLQEEGGGRCRTAPVRQGGDSQNPDPPVKHDGQHIADPRAVAWFQGLLAIDSHMTRFDQSRRCLTGSDDAGAPEPFIKALAAVRLLTGRQAWP